ncbi:MAG: Jag N-terminal domain-containing protein [Chloroflexi bacterium]|jgi:spoIIIJ-associated protein|nr:Jag N-terminal domain-containing protein [Chloroflexota bacterium]
MSTDAYREFTGKTVEEAIRAARDEFAVGLDELDFEILTSGSRGVLGMGAEPARIIAAPRSALGGSAPKREAAAAQPLPAPSGDDRPPRRDDRGPRRDDRGRRDDRPPRRDDRPPRPESRPPAEREPSPAAAASEPPAQEERPASGPRRDRGPARERSTTVSEGEAREVQAARSLAREREELQAAEASPEALEAGREILSELMDHLGFDVDVEVDMGETNRLNVVGRGHEKEALGALIGRKGERLSALQHLLNLMLSRRMGEWTRVLVDVEDYRGRRERQLRELAAKAAQRVTETGKMVQFEPMPALERRWLHLALRDDPNVVTQSIGEEPDRRVVVLPRAV